MEYDYDDTSNYNNGGDAHYDSLFTNYGCCASGNHRRHVRVAIHVRPEGARCARRYEHTECGWRTIRLGSGARPLSYGKLIDLFLGVPDEASPADTGDDKDWISDDERLSRVVLVALRFGDARELIGLRDCERRCRLAPAERVDVQRR